MGYTLVTDSTCDLPEDLLYRYNIQIIPLELREETVAGENRRGVFFYQRLLEGADIRTSRTSVQDAERILNQILSTGSDVLYLGFSSGLAGEFAAVNTAMNGLRGRYPERKLVAVDTLAASLGQGMLVVLTARLKEQGASLEEATQFAEETKGRIQHLFTVDSPKFLFRGGRASAASAAWHAIMDFKPILRVDEEGKLVPIDRKKGADHAVQALLDRMDADMQKNVKHPIYIAHADAYDRARYIENYARAAYGNEEIRINEVSSVIGAHTGPGTVAVFFLSDQR